MKQISVAAQKFCILPFSKKRKLSILTTKMLNKSAVVSRLKQQNAFFFEPSLLLSKIEKDGAEQKTYENLYKKIPVVLLLGWAGSKDKNLKKYQSIYSTMGYHVIRFAPSNGLTFMETKSHPKYTYELLNLMKDQYQLTSNPIVTHIFSNASLCILYQHIINEITQNKSSYEFFKTNHRAAIFDSAPGLAVSPMQLLRGISDLIKPQFKSAIMRYLVSSVLVSGAVGYHLVNLGDHYFTNMYKTFQADSRLVPTLVFYSTIDKLISGKNIAEQCRQKKLLHPNLYLKAIEYTDAEHVLIYAKHPDEYLKYVSDHLRMCRLDIKTVLNDSNVDVDVNLNNLADSAQLKSKL